MPRKRVDCMGYDIAPVWALFTEQEVHAAKRLAAARWPNHCVVRHDPRVMGWRYLRDAKIVLSGVDLGASCPVDR